MPKFYKHNSLKPFPLDAESVNLVFTSPPYFNLRNYRNEPDQIGAEETIQDYVDKMVQVGRNVRDVLTPDGSYFLNIGDKYIDKRLTMVPYRVAIGMMDDGWILRNIIIWYKPNRMPCSIKDRLTNAYEPIFHFTKNEKYYYNLDAIRVPHETIKVERYLDNANLSAKLGRKVETWKQGTLFDIEEVTTTEGYKSTKLEGETDIKNLGARWGFNRYGEKLENRYADGGKNPGDVFFDEKVAPYLTPETERSIQDRCDLVKGSASRPTARLYAGSVGGHPLGKNPGDVYPDNSGIGEHTERDTTGLWLLNTLQVACPNCDTEFQTAVDQIYLQNPDDIWEVNTKGEKDSHFAMFPPKLAELVIKVASRQGDVVLDQFSGSGTTAIVAEQLHRQGVGFDIEYSDVREKKVGQGIQTELCFDID